MKNFIKISVLLLFLGGAVYVSYKLYNRYKLYALKEEVSGKFINQTAPDIKTTSIDGMSWYLSKQKGKVVIAVFWATWCPNCIAEIPDIKKLYETYKNNPKVEIVSIALDKEKEKVASFIQRNAITYPVLFEEGKAFDNSFAKAVRILGIPSTWIISKEGKFVASNLIHMKDVVSVLEKALHERGK